MITALALDDEPIALEILEIFCSKATGIELVRSFTKPIEAIKYIQKFPIDLVFLDINMPNFSGLDVFKSLNRDIMVVLVTAHSEYAVLSYELNVLDYLLKPFEYERFLLTVEKAQNQFKRKTLSKCKDDFLLIRSENSLLRIKIDELVYFESAGDHIKIFTSSAKPIVTRMTMKKILELLPPDQFIRIHRCYIIAKSKIKKIADKKITINNISIPIGIRFEENLRMYLQDQSNDYLS